MKKNLNDFKRLLLTACCTLVLSCGWAAVNEKPFVIPELKQWSGAEGMFTPSGKYVPQGSVVVTAGGVTLTEGTDYSVE